MVLVKFKSELTFASEQSVLDYVNDFSINKKEIMERISSLYGVSEEAIKQYDDFLLDEIGTDMAFILDEIFQIEKGLFDIDWTFDSTDNPVWTVTEVEL